MAKIKVQAYLKNFLYDFSITNFDKDLKNDESKEAEELSAFLYSISSGENFELEFDTVKKTLKFVKAKE